MSSNNTSKNLINNLGFQWASTVYIAVIGFILSVILARELGVINYGNYSYILSLAYIFAIMQDGGYKTLIFRKSVNKNSQSLFSSAILHLASITIIGVLIIYFFRPHHWITLLTAILCFGLIVLCGFVSNRLKGEGKFKSEAIWQIFIKSLTASAILLTLFFYKDSSITSIFIAWSLAIVLALFWPIIKGYLFWPSFNFKGEVFKSSMVFLAIDFATVLYFRSDIVLLEYYGHTDGDVGQYSAAYRFLEGIILLATPIAQISFRSLRLSQNQKEFFALLGWLILLMLLIASIIILIGLFFGANLVLITFGVDYTFAGELLPLLLFAILFILPNYILTQGTIALNKEISFAKIVLFVALLNILLNLFFIPIYGALGAAFTTIFSEGILFLCLGWLMFCELRKNK